MKAALDVIVLELLPMQHECCQQSLGQRPGRCGCRTGRLHYFHVLCLLPPAPLLFVGLDLDSTDSFSYLAGTLVDVLPMSAWRRHRSLEATDCTWYVRL